ncbi:MAG TPA: hypothetical protein VGO40_19795 [Longimicrobium sp.]|jgi:hypothetical protein|nr:hypothetical protein [Longimicrobium sp.]
MKLGLMAVAAAMAAVASGSAAAQRQMVEPGMTPAQVRGIFGAPARTREAGEWSYWFYANGCPIRCGSDDVVFFHNQQVVTAVLRSRRREVTGLAAAAALERAGGDLDADAIRAQAGEAPPALHAPKRTRGRERNRETDFQDVAPSRVGRIHVESGGRTIDRRPVGQVRDVPAEAGSAIIRAPAGQEQGANGPRGVRNPVGTARDSVQGAPATAVDDERAAREAEIRRNTVQNQPDTLQARRTNREKSVTPRVVPRP